MNSPMSNVDKEHADTVSAGPNPYRVFAAVMLAALAPTGTAFADYTCVRSALNSIAECDDPGLCPEADPVTDPVVEVFFSPSSLGCGGGCYVTHVVVDTFGPCTDYADPSVASLKLYNRPSDPDCQSNPCVLGSLEVDLLSLNPFPFTQAKWEALLLGNSYVVVAEIDTDGDGLILDTIRKCASKYVGTSCPAENIPALSDWGVLAIALLFLVVGTLEVRRRHSVPT